MKNYNYDLDGVLCYTDSKVEVAESDAGYLNLWAYDSTMVFEEVDVE